MINISRTKGGIEIFISSINPTRNTGDVQRSKLRRNSYSLSSDMFEAIKSDKNIAIPPNLETDCLCKVWGDSLKFLIPARTKNISRNIRELATNNDIRKTVIWFYLQIYFLSSHKWKIENIIIHILSQRKIIVRNISGYQFQVNCVNSIKISQKCNVVFTGILLAILLLMSNINTYRLVRGLEDSWLKTQM